MGLHYFPRAAVKSTSNGWFKITKIYALTVLEARNP